MCPRSRTSKGAANLLRSFRRAACERRWARFTLLGECGLCALRQAQGRGHRLRVNEGTDVVHLVGAGCA